MPITPEPALPPDPAPGEAISAEPPATAASTRRADLPLGNAELQLGADPPAAVATDPVVPFEADGLERPLAPEYVTVARLSGLIWAAVLTAVAVPILAIVVAAVDAFTLAAAALIWLALAALVALPAWFWPPIAYRHRAYRFEPQGLHLRRGVLWRSDIGVPRSRIQHTDVSQGPLERTYGLATLTVHTAGNHYAAVSLAGLRHAEALAARDFLLAAGATEKGDAV